MGQELAIVNNNLTKGKHVPTNGFFIQQLLLKKQDDD
jgi:hypothetical protein